MTSRKTVVMAAISLLVAACSVIGGARDARPEVTLCADSSGMNTELFMIFDLKDSGILSAPTSEIVTLSTPSVSINPWTGFSRGDFFISIDEGRGMVYGSYSFVNVTVEGEERSIGVFKRAGTGEKAIGQVKESIVVSDGKATVKIGDVRFMNVKTAEGERSVRAQKLSSGSGQWLVQLGDKILSVDAHGALTQVGYADWRKINTAEGKPLVIIMTKGMKKGAVWTGRFDGKLYRDKQ